MFWSVGFAGWDLKVILLPPILPRPLPQMRILFGFSLWGSGESLNHVLSSYIVRLEIIVIFLFKFEYKQYYTKTGRTMYDKPTWLEDLRDPYKEDLETILIPLP